MPALIFVENDEMFKARMVHTGDVVRDGDQPAKMSMENLMKLSKKELVSLIPPEKPIRKDSAKAIIAYHLMEVWDIVKPSPESLAGACNDAGGSGGDDDDEDFGKDNDDDNNDDNNDEQDGSPSPMPSDSDDEDEFQVSIMFPDNQMKKVYVKETDTVLNVKGVIRNKFGISRHHQRLLLDGEDLEDKCFLKDYNIGEDTVLNLFLTIGGGGKRGADGSSRNNSKKSKQEKILDIVDGVETVRLKVQSSPLTTVATNGMSMIELAKTSAEQMPDTAVANALQHFDIIQLKRLQVALTSGNGEHKVHCFSKELFIQLVSSIDQVKRQFAMIQQAMTDVSLMICLQQFGSEDGSIQWTALAALVGDVLEAKSKEVGRQSTATPAS